MVFNDLMDNIEWFFNLHDKDKDGYLSKDEVLTLSESLLVSIFSLMSCADTEFSQFIFRYEVGDAYLGAVSRFMTNSFEYGDALLAQPEDNESPESPQISNNQPYLNLATYGRMRYLSRHITETPLGFAWLSSPTRF